MDCYIIRIYRHISGKNGEPDEIAGLVEQVGSTDHSKPFRSYQQLVNTLRGEVSAMADAPGSNRLTAADLKIVKNTVR